MIGKLCKASTPFYDNVRKSMSYKNRPALILAKADADDYVILPVSSITRKQNIDPVYDIAIDPSMYPRLNLTKTSYVRTHKQTIVHRNSLVGVISDMRLEYEDLYLKILEKREQFSKEITEQAL